MATDRNHDAAAIRLDGLRRDYGERTALEGVALTLAAGDSLVVTLDDAAKSAIVSTTSRLEQLLLPLHGCRCDRHPLQSRPGPRRKLIAWPSVTPVVAARSCEHPSMSTHAIVVPPGNQNGEA